LNEMTTKTKKEKRFNYSYTLGNTRHQEEDGDVTGVNSRHIKFNQPADPGFSDNEISTAKYNFFTFIPKFLFEQFRRYANIFFLSIGLLQQIPGVSPTGRYVTIVPFILILILTAIKELVEDFKRHSADRKVNQTEVEVLTPEGQIIRKMWKDVQVGNILKVKNDKFFSCRFDIIELV